MSAQRGALRVGQVCLLLLVAWGLFHWWTKRPPVIVSDDAIDDLIEEVGDTYVPVHVGDIERGTLRKYVTAYGSVQPAPAMAGHDAGGAKITSPSTAMIASVDCTEGHLVQKGEPLFTLDARAADAAIDTAEKLVIADRAAIEQISKQATTQDTKQEFGTPAWKVADAQRQLVADQAVLDRARNQRNLLIVAAPIAGTITNVNIAAGEMSDPGKIAVELVDLDRLVATVDVPAANLAELQVGQPATIDSPSLSGTVLMIDSAINPATGMGSADIALPANSGLRPGQFVRAQITTGEEADRLIVPVQSITQNQNGDSSVGKVETDGRWAVLVPVKTGWRDGDKIEIEGEGLAAGQSVVTVGANGLVQRTRLHLLKD